MRHGILAVREKSKASLIDAPLSVAIPGANFNSGDRINDIRHKVFLLPLSPQGPSKGNPDDFWITCKEVLPSR